jgi:REP element-mobilizing transposase RayT
MGSTFFSLHYHLVSRPKNDDPSLSQNGNHVFILTGVPEIVGGVEDHVHVLASLRPVHCIADVLRDLKKESSTWAKENFDRRFTWAFTVSPRATDSVRRYIATQQAHHRKRSFVDELRELLNAAGIEFDERYLL